MDDLFNSNEELESVGDHSLPLSQLNAPLPSIDLLLYRKLRISFRILISLGTKEMYLWCPRYHHISPKRKSIDVGIYNISIRTHLRSEYEEIAPLMRANDIAFKQTYHQLKQAVAMGLDMAQLLSVYGMDLYVQKQKNLHHQDRVRNRATLLKEQAAKSPRRQSFDLNKGLHVLL